MDLHHDLVLDQFLQHSSEHSFQPFEHLGTVFFKVPFKESSGCFALRTG